MAYLSRARTFAERLCTLRGSAPLLATGFYSLTMLLYALTVSSAVLSQVKLLA